MSTEDTTHILPLYEVSSLPSNFLGYPKDITISVRPFSFGEQVNMLKSGMREKDLFKSILEGVTCNYPKNLLTPQDVMFLGVYRKLVSTKHDKITVESVCPECAKKNKSDLTLKQLQFKQPEFKQIPLKVNLEHYTIWFKLLSVKDFLACVKEHNAEPLAMLISQVDKIYDNEKQDYIDMKRSDSYETIRGIIGGATDFDKEVLDEVADILSDYGLKPVDVECDDEFCKHKYQADLEDKTVLVYPFRDSEKSARSRIELGGVSDNRSVSPSSDGL